MRIIELAHGRTAPRRRRRAAAGRRRADAAKLRVLTVIDHLGAHRGGAERIALDVLHGTDPARYERTLCVTHWSDEELAKPYVVQTMAELRARGIGFIGLRRTSRWRFWEWWPLVAHLLTGRADVVHAHKYGCNLPAVVLGRLARVPVVIAHEHSFPVDEERVRRVLSHHIVGRAADAVVAVCEPDWRRMVEEEGLPPRRVVYIPNGIPALPPPAHDVRAELGIDPGAPVLGVVAGLRAVKGLDVLIRACAALAPAFPGLRLLIVGWGPPEVRQELGDLASRLGIERQVLLLGSRKDMPDVLAALDVAVSSSRWEGSPLAILEYMDAGKPVVATRVGGTPGLLEDGVGATLVPSDDHVALAGAIAELLADPQRRAEMGAANRARRMAVFDSRTMLSRTEGLYADLYERRRREGRPASIPVRA